MSNHQETDKLEEADFHKYVDGEDVPYAVYKRMVAHAQDLEERLGHERQEKTGCERLLEEAEYEIFDVLRDGQSVVIEMHPGHNGQSSYLFWRPISASVAEAQLWEFVTDSPSNEVRNMSFIGAPARWLKKFVERVDDSTNQLTSKEDK